MCTTNKKNQVILRPCVPDPIFRFLDAFRELLLNVPRGSGGLRLKSRSVFVFSEGEISFTFLQGSLNPQNYELGPQTPKIKYQCSPAP